MLRTVLTLASTIVAVLLPATLVHAGTSPGASPRQPERKWAGPASLDWTWSDGRSDANRVFISSQFSAQSLPKLHARMPDGRPGVLYLEFKQDGVWNAEWATKPGTNGIATLPIDPYCANNSWCNGTYEYRLRMSGLVSYFAISYWDR